MFFCRANTGDVCKLVGLPNKSPPLVAVHRGNGSFSFACFCLVGFLRDANFKLDSFLLTIGKANFVFGANWRLSARVSARFVLNAVGKDDECGWGKE